MNTLIKELELFESIMCEPKQKAFYSQMFNDAKEVNVVSLSEVFSDAQIKRIKSLVKPKMKECYKNAHTFCSMFTGVIYCEGKITCCGIGIDHAFNRIGDKYVDITMELALNKDVTKESYISIGEYDYQTISKVTLKTGVYGNIYGELYCEQLKSKQNV